MNKLQVIAQKLLIVGIMLQVAACTPPVRLALPPAELAVCADEPAAPNLPAVDWTSVDAARPVQAARDTMMLAYVLALRSAWGDCKADSDALAAWREQAR